MIRYQQILTKTQVKVSPLPVKNRPETAKKYFSLYLINTGQINIRYTK